MTSVTYKHQPGIQRTRGSVPLAGTSYPYKVSKRLWPDEIEMYLKSQFIGRTLHVCCGKSLLGDVRGDLYEHNVDVVLDAADLPFANQSFDTVLSDPGYSSKFQWNHDHLSEICRVAAKRIIYQNWYVPANREGYYKKCHVFQLTDLTIVPTLSIHEKELRVCLFDAETGEYWVAEEMKDQEMCFLLEDVVAWQPQTYFGRTQLISVFTRTGSKDD